MGWILHVGIIVVSFSLMEFMAWFTHKYVMHGFLWILHRDHHIRDGRRFEWNDIFALVFAIPSIILIFNGIQQAAPFKLSVGIGIALYGLAYFLFHDIYVHERIKLKNMPQNKYLRATLRAHLDHHQPHSHHNFGFLVAPLKYYADEWANKV